MPPEMIVRARGDTDPAHGKPPSARTIEEHLRLGVVNLDKPAGPTSHQVVAWLKLAIKVDKAGHGGTLDPQVTGVLPVAILDATRVVRTLLEAPKEYVCVFEAHREVKPDRVREVLQEFTGPIYQVPPLKSAVKRELRVRRVYRTEVIETTPRLALFRTSCQAGTYIRKLCHDVGLVLGPGGHMRDLRRSVTGPFREETSVTLQDLRDAYEHWVETKDESWLREVVRPVEELVGHLPRVVIRDTAVDALCHGADLAIPGVLEMEKTLAKDDLAACFTLKGELVAVGRAKMSADDASKRDSGVLLKTERVVMAPGTYPKGWGQPGAA
ncbi:MAG TPA: RNA-guided pseudouridylation complex pseudouridine synthase subunit Cbf5 [Candidatus Thermoplasmatota archaeon]|nr:RNA-guided pseudouridylation complex pseudouridine synthase subunit Cbf5 [Candidatus Thermoplasmatota archaeon]